MHFNQLDLNLLVALDALLDEKSITRAGHRINLSQSAMSGCLARLREFFNDELLVQVGRKAAGARNYTACDSMLVGKAAEAHTYPYVDVQRHDAQVEHEASTSKLSEDQLFYLRSRGIAQEDAVGAIVNGFCKDVLEVLPLEFAAEARKLLALKLENSVG